MSEPSQPTLRQKLVALFPAGQLIPYLCVGVFNTIFGYAAFVVILTLLNRVVPHQWLSLTAVLASILSTPLSITVAYFGYKFFVFRTRGNYLREWLKAFAVYGTAMIPGLLILGALTRLLQSLFHSHSAVLHSMLFSFESHLSGKPLNLVQHLATGSAAAGYIAGALMTGFTTISSFIGHKKVTFRERPSNAAIEPVGPTE